MAKTLQSLKHSAATFIIVIQLDNNIRRSQEKTEERLVRVEGPSTALEKFSNQGCLSDHAGDFEHSTAPQGLLVKSILSFLSF